MGGKGAVAVAGLVAIASAVGGWAIAQNPGANPRTAAVSGPPSTAIRGEHAPAATPDRLFLTAAQVQQAMASGTLDRPVKSLLRVDRPLAYGDYRWDDSAVPQGPTWIRVDLRAQLLSVFRGGHEIGTAVIVYGGDNKQTPHGSLRILARLRDHRSSIYDADMPYTLRLTGDGVSIHGSAVRGGAATHGCIGVPLEFARRLFAATRVGDEVVVSTTRPSST